MSDGERAAAGVFSVAATLAMLALICLLARAYL